MININVLQTDSRKVKPGDTFFALKGISRDGHDYINQAIEKGATRIIASQTGNYNSSNIEYVDDSTKYLNNILINECLPLFKDMKFVGLTGTNGKTTTCFLIYQILNMLKSKTAYIGTIGFYDGDNIITLDNTTPDILELYKLINQAYENGCKNIVMEVSSHALDQERIKGLLFDVAGYTNISQDHLDYHKTMENYLIAKAKILNYLKPSGKIIVNIDDDHSNRFINHQALTLGFKESDYQILSRVEKNDHTVIEFNNNGQIYEVKTNLISKFNVYNYLTALGIVHILGFNIEQIIGVTKDVFPPKGRVDTIKVGNGLAIVDYAHTPDAVEKIISQFNQDKNRRLITVLGCGGDRDPLKRPIMGNLATTLSNYVILTSDNPRTEDPNKIIDDIIKGVNNNNYEVEVNRNFAIIKALKMIKTNEIVLILGKGHEDYQEINHEKHHFDDKEEVLKFLKLND